ncbi:PREDICTED: interleukin-2 receptor subunit beta [Chrysochloris asiatica]|uniref:Interleukin-2 receptor subunit beta n=1 Tax=Chrysochloris asiatica TaxID=185453 RepID=A0A9B0TPF1_CHRAS|nr:PREDICTED: interleukin-2 receptor subunit beta [Chrysochloris asiatica]
MAAPPLSWHLPLLMLLLPLASPGPSTAVKDASTLTCFYNSKANISCDWSRDGALQAQDCELHAQSENRWWNKTCKLLPTSRESWTCNLIIGSPESQILTAADVVTISVKCHQGKQQWVATSLYFKPFDNLRLMAPTSLQIVKIEARRCNVTWTLPQVSHYIKHYLEFQVRTRLQGHSWGETLSIKQNQQWLYLETLSPDTTYELQVQTRARKDINMTWSPWSQPLSFRTRPEAPGKTLPLSWRSYMIGGVSGTITFIFIILVCLLVKCQYISPWLKKVLECRIPDPSEFFSQLSEEHGGDFQKWLSSPFPSASFSPHGTAPEISPLEVMDRDAKTTQLLLCPQDKVPMPSPSSHSHTSCFTNQGYFFFHLPDALEIEACQVYFTYDPCTAEPDEGRSGAPAGSPQLALPPQPGEDDAYCTFPPGEDLLLFSPGLLGGPGPPNTAQGGSGTREERQHFCLQGDVCGESASRPVGSPAPGSPSLVSVKELAPGEGGEQVPVPGSEEGDGCPWDTFPGQGQAKALTSSLTQNTDVYLSLQELQDQDPAHLS